MAHDIFLGRTTKDWSCGASSDLPASAERYVPNSFWGPEQMEVKIASLMSKPKGMFGLGGKPTRPEAISMLTDYMRANKIGPMNISGSGSVVLSKSEQDKLYRKIDDVRYDLRSVKGIVGAGVFTLAGALAFLGVASVYRTSAGK